MLQLLTMQCIYIVGIRESLKSNKEDDFGMIRPEVS